MPTADIDLPAFSSIRIANIEPVLRELLDAHRAQLAALLARPDASWDSLVVPLEEMHHRLARTCNARAVRAFAPLSLAESMP